MGCFRVPDAWSRFLVTHSFDHLYIRRVLVPFYLRFFYKNPLESEDDHSRIQDSSHFSKICDRISISKSCPFHKEYEHVKISFERMQEEPWAFLFFPENMKKHMMSREHLMYH